ncbi:MAG: DUF2842 domain-containing protein [Rhodobacteraceae bacterium]|nr:DUF2842 domain-containing protein [Paracoccaceae bacterium]
MALGYKTRRRLSLLILLVGLPLYIVVAVNLVDWLNAWRGRPSVPMEFLVYVGLGVLWALPLRAVFRGVGQDDPDAPKDS